MDRARRTLLCGLHPGPWLALARDAVVLGVMAYRMITYPNPTLTVIDRIATHLPSRVGVFVDRFAESVLKGFASLRSPGRLAIAGLLSIVLWLCIVSGLIAYFRALS